VKRTSWAWSCLLATGGLVVFAVSVSAQNSPKAKEFRIERSMPQQAIVCLECHRSTTPGIFADWTASRHAAANISCLDCHQAEEHDPDMSRSHYQYYVKETSTKHSLIHNK
jgi:hydroxylamine dehydrogenase